MPVTDPIREAVKQAAREAMASLVDRVPNKSGVASEIRAGKQDGKPAVRAAILGALAALDAVYPLIREAVLREAAGVAKNYAASAAFGMVYHNGATQASEYIEREILALAAAEPQEGGGR